jgi:hypothetical protein
MRRLIYLLLGILIGLAAPAVAREHTLTIESAGIPARHVKLMEDLTPGESRGSIILTTGQGGTAPYRGRWRDQTLAALHALGFDTWQVIYMDRDGWITGAAGKGYRGGTALFEDVVAYVRANGRSEHIGAQGNSGGAMQILYALEAGTALDVAIGTGIPFASHRAVESEEIVFCWGDDRTGYLLGWPNGVCRGAGNYTVAQVQQMDADALLNGAGSLSGVFLVASADNERDLTALQRLYRAMSKPKKKRLCPGDAHDVDDTECGSQRIVTIFDNRMPSK